MPRRLGAFCTAAVDPISASDRITGDSIARVALDVKNKSVIAGDKHLNSVLTFYLPEVF